MASQLSLARISNSVDSSGETFSTSLIGLVSALVACTLKSFLPLILERVLELVGAGVTLAFDSTELVDADASVTRVDACVLRLFPLPAPNGR